MTPEGAVKAKVRKALHNAGLYTFPVNQRGIGRRGIPDDFLILGGRPVFIEYKAECRWDKNTKSALSTLPTVLQLLEMDKIRSANGITYVIDRNNADEFIAAVSAGEFYKHYWLMSLETYEWYRNLDAVEFEKLHDAMQGMQSKPYEFLEILHASLIKE